MSVLKISLEQIGMVGTALGCISSFLIGIVSLKVVIEEMINYFITHKTSQTNLTDNINQTM